MRHTPLLRAVLIAAAFEPCIVLIINITHVEKALTYRTEHVAEQLSRFRTSHLAVAFNSLSSYWDLPGRFSRVCFVQSVSRVWEPVRKPSLNCVLVFQEFQEAKL